MDRREFVSHTALLGVAAGLGTRPGATVQAPRALIMDAMGELRNEYEDALIRDMLGSGIRSITVTLCDPKPTGAVGLEHAIDGVVEYDKMIAGRSRYFIRATSVNQIDDARRGGKMAVFYLFQNSDQFGADLDRVDLFYRLGVRSSQITYNDRNRAGTGCRAGEEGGLTDFGRQLVERMNRIGMLVDLSHANQRTMAETAAASRKPVIISHTACMAVHRNIRNATDEVLRAVTKTGGVVGVCQMRPFLTTKKKDNLHTYFDHIDHAVKVAGIEHVGIGSDRDHRVITLTPEYLAELKKEEGSQVVDSDLPYFIDELNGPRRMEVIWSGLESRGYKGADIEKIMGGNVYRLYKDVIG